MYRLINDNPVYTGKKWQILVEILNMVPTGLVCLKSHWILANHGQSIEFYIICVTCAESTKLEALKQDNIFPEKTQNGPGKWCQGLRVLKKSLIFFSDIMNVWESCNIKTTKRSTKLLHLYFQVDHHQPTTTERPAAASPTAAAASAPPPPHLIPPQQHHTPNMLKEQDSSATPGSMSQPTPGSGGGGDAGPGSIKTEPNIKEEPKDSGDIAEKIKHEQQQKKANGTLDGLGGSGEFSNGVCWMRIV